MTEHEKIVNNIKAEIARKGLSISQVAGMIGISPRSYITRLNNFAKGQDVTYSLFEKSSKVLNLPVKIFFEI